MWNSMPVVMWAGFMALQVRHLGSSPRTYWEGVNKLLGELKLVDHMTGVVFRTVPWECCPQEPVEEVVKWLKDHEVVVQKEIRT